MNKNSLTHERILAVLPAHDEPGLSAREIAQRAKYRSQGAVWTGLMELCTTGRALRHVYPGMKRATTYTKTPSESASEPTPQPNSEPPRCPGHPNHILTLRKFADLCEHWADNNHPHNRDETIMATLLLGMAAQLRNISNAL